MRTLHNLLENAPKLLAECAVAERLRRIDGVELHPTLFNTPLIYGPEFGKAALTAVYEEYLEIAQSAKLPLLLTAPTWRLDAARVKAAEVPVTINKDAVDFLCGVRDSFGSSEPVFVGALVGPQNDCYRPDLSPDTDATQSFHAHQIAELAETEADFLLAQTIPSVREAVGIAREFSKSTKPWLISFCVAPDGMLLDGTPLPEACSIVARDLQLHSAPSGFMVNCTHPSFLLENYSEGELDCLVGIQANGSCKDVRSLDGAAETIADPVSSWATAMLELHTKHKVKVLGGCCGTSSEHMQSITGQR